MKTNKEYRFENNPKEKEFHDKFIELFQYNNESLSAIVFGWTNDKQTTPNFYINEIEESICVNLIQWLGSPVGQSFLRDCGFVQK